ncbi:MAG TPA: PKD domain-containing protein [Solirubrobacteraceae bacterium]|nr:PKD domain-containing protein [Solirubrobacteraceae bacterium]
MISLVTLACGPVCIADAAPSVSILSPANGSVTNNPTPRFSGVAQEGGGGVTLEICRGPCSEATIEEELSTALLGPLGEWSLGPIERHLADGTYVALARQAGGTSSITFTVLSAPPTVRLNPPASPPWDTSPSFTGTASDTTPVSVLIHAGPTTKGTIVASATATGTGAGWTSGEVSPALPEGQYTAVASQESSLGNPPGRSAPMTFMVVGPPPPPVASFKWFPPVPQTGEPVSIVSNSSDATSPITGTAWALGGDSPFQSGGPVLNTSFATPGAHVVRLLVTDANGFSTTVTETIPVVTPRVLLMQPFPVVRIAGTETRAGIRLRLLRVQQTPAGAKVVIRCKGRGCPTKTQRRYALAGPRGVAPVDFRAFQSVLRAGITLEILISKPGAIGKYTRFTVRRHRLPVRVDSCLDPLGINPLACPPS